MNQSFAKALLYQVYGTISIAVSFAQHEYVRLLFVDFLLLLSQKTAPTLSGKKELLILLLMVKDNLLL